MTRTDFCVYGLFCGSKCVYIGSSGNINRRMRHEHNKCHRLDFKVLVYTDTLKEAREIERAVIFKIKRKGECDLNSKAGDLRRPIKFIG
jgi:predicted GIY-YIG superfamily endonuclease